MKYLHLCGPVHGMTLDVPDGVVVHTVRELEDRTETHYHRLEIRIDNAQFAVFLLEHDHDQFTSLYDAWFQGVLADALRHPR